MRRQARAFFEENFRPVRIARLGEAEGFLTGYYEPIVAGSRFPNPEFHVPSIAGRAISSLPVTGRGLKPFPTKASRSDVATRRTRSFPIMIAAR